VKSYHLFQITAWSEITFWQGMQMKILNSFRVDKINTNNWIFLTDFVKMILLSMYIFNLSIIFRLSNFLLYLNHYIWQQKSQSLAITIFLAQGVYFTNMLTFSFYVHRSRQSSHQWSVFFCAFGICAHKTLVNWHKASISSAFLCELFLPLSFCQKVKKPNCN